MKWVRIARAEWGVTYSRNGNVSVSKKIHKTNDEARVPTSITYSLRGSHSPCFDCAEIQIGMSLDKVNHFLVFVCCKLNLIAAAYRDEIVERKQASKH
jgi:hypothetical protein